MLLSFFTFSTWYKWGKRDMPLDKWFEIGGSRS